MKITGKPKERCLLTTMTNEPFQPVRLYYAIPDRSFVTERLRSLRCMAEVPPERCWQWLFDAEAASLRFAAGYDEVPKEKRPIVIGRIRFPKGGGRRLDSKEDVPMIEDFPLGPEEETPEFHHLATGLQLRLVRAVEHWRGNTHLTLAAIIVRTVEENARARGGR